MTTECTCGARVIEALLSANVVKVDAEPSPEGNLLLRSTGGQRPVATRLTTAQQFGRQGQLRTQHRCVQRRAVAA